jgi:hypothetical protein
MKIHLRPELKEMVKQDVRVKLEQGYAAAQRGELIGSDEVRSRLGERKRAWLAEKRQA